jgi:hypothetical protein
MVILLGITGPTDAASTWRGPRPVAVGLGWEIVLPDGRVEKAAVKVPAAGRVASKADELAVGFALCADPLRGLPRNRISQEEWYRPI